MAKVFARSYILFYFYFLILFNTCALDCEEGFIWQQMSKKKTKQKQPIKIKNLLDLCIFFFLYFLKDICPSKYVFKELLFSTPSPTIIINLQKLIFKCWNFSKSYSKYLSKIPTTSGELKNWIYISFYSIKNNTLTLK